MKPHVTAFFDDPTNTLSYVVADPESGRCAIIDPVLDYNQKSGRTNTVSADRIIDHVAANGLEVDWILETHAHADHVSGAHYLRGRLGAPIGIGRHITAVQETFGKVFNLAEGFEADGSQFGRLFSDGETFAVGKLPVEVLHTPGHTPACVTYVMGDAAFVGDTLFMPDFGTARCDFPGGDARTLYRSIRRVLSLPPETRLFMCHDYMPNGRELRWETSVAEQRSDNIHVRDGISEKDFVEMRQKRDRTLDMPALILPSIQINIRAGALPSPEDNGIAYLKIPLNAL